MDGITLRAYAGMSGEALRHWSAKIGAELIRPPVILNRLHGFPANATNDGPEWTAYRAARAEEYEREAQRLYFWLGANEEHCDCE